MTERRFDVTQVAKDRRCVPFWTGHEWWCEHTRLGLLSIDTDWQARSHYHTARERAELERRGESV